MTPQEALDIVRQDMSLVGNAELELIISTNANISYSYALQCLKRNRFELGEAIILTCPMTAMAYAGDIIKGPWPAAEQIIATNSSASYAYAMYNLKNRFLLAEENSLITTNNFADLFNYVTKVPNVDNKVLIDRLIASPYGRFYKE